MKALSCTFYFFFINSCSWLHGWAQCKCAHRASSFSTPMHSFMTWWLRNAVNLIYSFQYLNVGKHNKSINVNNKEKRNLRTVTIIANRHSIGKSSIRACVGTTQKPLKTWSWVCIKDVGGRRIPHAHNGKLEIMQNIVSTGWSWNHL